MATGLDNPLAIRQHGHYQELLAHLRGEQSLQAARDKIVIRTRQFAKRQETWFRQLTNCVRVSVQTPDFSRAAEVALRS